MKGCQGFTVYIDYKNQKICSTFFKFNYLMSKSFILKYQLSNSGIINNQLILVYYNLFTILKI